VESEDYLNQELDSKEELPEDVRHALSAGVAAAISEYKMIESVHDLVKTSWLMQMVVDKAMNAVEQSGVSFEGYEASATQAIADTLYELLPEGPGEEPEGAGDREPRNPVLPSLLGSIAMALPGESADAA
jgi:hypothetical protein